MRKPTQMQLLIRAIAGGYLIYIDYQMLTEGALTNYTGWKLALMIAAMIAFVGFGVFFIVKAFLNYKKFYMDAVTEEESEESTDTDEEVKAIESAEEPATELNQETNNE